MRSPIILCATMGSLVGGYVPVLLWHASSFGVTSFLFGGVGAVAGVFVGARVLEL
jgi:hypothetical protein